MIRALLVFILFGGVFLTSSLFMEYWSQPKEYYLLITSLAFLLWCVVSRNGFQKLLESLKSHGLFYGISIVCLLTTIHGLLQYVGIIPSFHKAFLVTGTFENPAGFATVQAAMFPFAFIMCFNKDNGRLPQIFSLVVSILCFISVVLAGSRMGFLAICTAIVVALAFTDAVSSFFKSHRWVWIPILIIVVSSLVALYYLKKDSADGRVFIWARCIELIKERPLFGYGAYGFTGNYMSAQADYFRANPDSPYVMLADNVTQPFNEYIKLAVNYGLVGLIAAVMLLVWIVLKLLGSDRQTKVLGLSFVASIFVMCQFSYPFMYDALWLLCFMAIAPAFLKTGKQIVVPGYMRILAASLLLGVLAISLRTMYYDMKWTEMYKRTEQGYINRMMPHYADMKHVMKNNPLFAYNYAAELNKAQRFEESIEVLSACSKSWNDYNVQILYSDIYVKIGQMDKALIACNQAHNMVPCRFDPLYRKMLIYGFLNDTVNAVRTAYEILEKPVKVRSEQLNQMISVAENIVSHYDNE